MAMSSEQLVIDARSRFLEMKSLQPYSTTDEYLYAMKEDLAEWLANMYPDWRPITAENFLECLENGALLCHHANNVNEAARKSSSSSTPSILTNCKFRSDARCGTFNARDNVSQFIKWSRRIAGVREVLMFESDDLILRKNEKNFILCLLEIARFGARFGVSVPVIIKFEQEIEREIEHENQQILFESININKQRLNSQGSENSSSSNDLNSIVNIPHSNELINRIDMIDNQINTVDSSMNNTIDHEINTEMNVISRDISTMSNQEQEIRHKPMVAPASASHLHKTVVKIVNSCCCSQRFPVTRLGEGKYRIGENGTIIFIRILRNHVMVRVGGGWDTLENYLNKHDPCRRSGGHHHRNESHTHQHGEIPILAIPKPNVSSTAPSFGKSVQLKTEEFPLAKSSTHDTNLVDAQLVITRGADGRHRIGQITYKAEEEITSTCSHHQSPTSTKVKSVRTTPIKQSSPSTTTTIDHDYSSIEIKEDFVEQAMKSLNLSVLENRSISYKTPPKMSIPTETIRRPPPPKFDLNKANITESFIGNIDNSISTNFEQDFDLNDIVDVMKNRSNDMDDDSLESNEELQDEKPKTSTPKKSTTYQSAFYLAEKQKAANRRRSTTNLNRQTSRSSTISNLIEKERRKPLIVSHRSHSTDIFDSSKLDRDSGFDEQDFRRERLLSNGDDNSSISSMKSSRPPTARSNNFQYKENKSYELRMKKLDEKRKESSRRSNETVLPPTNRYRKNSQTNLTLKLSTQNQKVNL